MKCITELRWKPDDPDDREFRKMTRWRERGRDFGENEWSGSLASWREHESIQSQWQHCDEWERRCYCVLICVWEELRGKKERREQSAWPSVTKCKWGSLWVSAVIRGISLLLIHKRANMHTYTLSDDGLRVLEHVMCLTGKIHVPYLSLSLSCPGIAVILEGKDDCSSLSLPTSLCREISIFRSPTEQQAVGFVIEETKDNLSVDEEGTFKKIVHTWHWNVWTSRSRFFGSTLCCFLLLFSAQASDVA